jgi:hypothetical protein
MPDTAVMGHQRRFGAASRFSALRTSPATIRRQFDQGDDTEEDAVFIDGREPGDNAGIR